MLEPPVSVTNPLESIGFGPRTGASRFDTAFFRFRFIERRTMRNTEIARSWWNMCLILFAYKQHSDYRLVLTANRDEFYERPTAALHFWEDYPQVLAGRDLLHRGTWMGITRSGRFAAITNYREVLAPSPSAPSRGDLVADFLTGSTPPETYLKQIHLVANQYSGFNLILGDVRSLYYYGNRDGRIRKLEPGLYGLSNRLLDTDWPKVRTGKTSLAAALQSNDGEPDGVDVQRLILLLQSRKQAPDHQLPQTGVGIEKERMLAPAFIASQNYGTRSSSILLIGQNDRVDFREICWAPGHATPHQTEDRRFRFNIVF